MKLKTKSEIKLKSGKLPYRHDPRTLSFSDFLKEQKSIKIPKEFNWGKKIKKDNWGDMGNLKINNCTCAAAAHLIMVWSSNTGKFRKPSDKNILKVYCNISGYDPKKGGEGNAVEALKTLKYWRNKGIDGYKIFAFAKIDENDRRQLLHAIYLFGGCYVGLNLPKTAEKQYNKSQKWSLPKGGAKGDGKPGSLFGHAVTVIGYKNNELRVITWGKEMIMTMDFWETYGEEAFVVFDETFIKHDKTPTGVDLEIIRAAIEIVAKIKRVPLPAD